MFLVFCAWALVFYSCWNLSKVPFYLAPSLAAYKWDDWDPEVCNTTSKPEVGYTVPYKCHGVEGSVNLGHWWEFRRR